MGFNLCMYDSKDYYIWFAGYKYEESHPLSGKSLKQWAVEENADMVFNGTWFNMPTAINKKKGIEYDTVCYMKGKGEIIGYGGVYERIIIDKNNEIGGCYVGIKDGVLKNNDTTTRTTRNGCGQTADGRFFVAQSTSMTNKAFCQNVITWLRKYYSTAAKLFILQDGGGSVGSYSTITSSLWAPKKEGNDGRPVANVICIKRKDIIPVIVRPLMKGYTGIDVMLLQQTLGGIEVDGSYGNATVNRVKEFQKRFGLEVDGKAGPNTLRLLRLL